MTDFLPVHEFCPVNISKLGYEVTDALANITVNEYKQKNNYTFKMAIKKVNQNYSNIIFEKNWIIEFSSTILELNLPHRMQQ